MMVIAVLKVDIVIDHTTICTRNEHNIRFDGARRIDDHPRTDATIMSHATTDHRPVRRAKLAIAIACT